MARTYSKTNPQKVVFSFRVSEAIAKELQAFCSQKGMEPADFGRQAVVNLLKAKTPAAS